jgi:NADH-quinone oxidoreductase subunit L
MFAALAVGGRTAALSHLFSHAAFKALLFLGAGVVIQAVGSNLMADMGGLRRGMPITFVTMTIGFAALAGLPPTSGFFSKDAIVAATGRHWPVLAAILLTEALTAAYATRAWRRTFFGPAQRSAREGGAVLLGPLVALAVPALLLGLVEPRPNLATAWITLLPVALGVGAGWFGWQRDLGPLFATACHTDDLYERTVVRAVLRLSDRVGGLDDGIGDTVTGTGRGAGRLGALLRRTQNGNPQFYLTGVLAGVVLIAVGAVVLA